jgi:prevent-host-death family protein
MLASLRSFALRLRGLDERTRRLCAVRADWGIMKQVPLSEVQSDLARHLRLAEEEEIVITRHGKPVGVLIGFESEDDWFEYRLEHDPRFLKRIEAARESLRSRGGVRLEDLPE